MHQEQQLSVLNPVMLVFIRALAEYSDEYPCARVTFFMFFNSLNKVFFNFPSNKSFFSYDCSALLIILMEIALYK